MKLTSPTLSSTAPEPAPAAEKTSARTPPSWDERTLRHEEFAALQRSSQSPVSLQDTPPAARNRTLQSEEFAALMRADAPAVETSAAPQAVPLQLPPTPPEFAHLYAALERQAAALSGRPAGSVGLTPPFALGVTSAVAGEGKTTVALHLALTAARDTFKRVCLLDMSLGANDLSRFLGLPGDGAGVVPILEDEGTIIPTLQITGCDNLVIIPAGKQPANPARLARSPRAAQLMASARFAFDLVIVDLPAVSTDNALPLCQPLDGLLVVVRSGATPQAVVANALDTLGRSRVLGVTLNGVAQVQTQKRR